MRSVRATDFVRNFAQIQHDIRREAIAVTSHGRTTGVLISPDDYAELESLRAKARQSLRVENLPDDVVRGLRETAMDRRHSSLNDLMDE
ncbi:type II toxin-antitoxin system Phd/YefM family antitoxin [Microvirga pudoricolor]|uniref:type II toxin-antitoxin system Phd/YefM family antitoxin n=1 Tax=Microvirga pudoricolor TaxID=2778729 RepID=UPI00195294E5|nr:type II toxin-antitoxin system Phd/YefM family antitoxin [Microvirga pudoricolor]